MRGNKSLKVLETPALEKAEKYFAKNSQVEEFIAPSLKYAGEDFMKKNKSLRKLVVSKDCNTTQLTRNVKSKIKKSQLILGVLNIPILKQIYNYKINKHSLEKSSAEEMNRKAM